MNTADIVILIVLAWGAFKGFRKGFIMEIVSVLALFLGILGAFKLLHFGMDWLDEYFEISGQLLPFVSFILLFIGIVILVNLLGKSVKKILDMALLGGFDSLAGAIIGIIKWAFGLSLLVWLSESFNVGPSEEITESSIFYPFIETMAPNVLDFLSGILPFANGLIESIEEMLGPS